MKLQIHQEVAAMQFEEKEETPYRKKKESSVSKSEVKSKHKHQYDKTVIVVYTLQHGMVISRPYYYCFICGKIGEDACSLFEDGRILELEDLVEKFPMAEIYQVDAKHAGSYHPKNIEDLKNKNIL